MRNGVAFYRLKLRETGVKDWSQKALADYVGITRSKLSMIENAHVIPTPGELERLAQYLEVTPGHLYTAQQIEIIYDMNGEKGRGENANQRTQ